MEILVFIIFKWGSGYDGGRCKIQFQIIFIHIFFIWIFRATTFPFLCIPFHSLPLCFPSLSGSFHYPNNLSLPSSTFCLNAFCILPVPVSFHPAWLPAIHLAPTCLLDISASPPLRHFTFTFLSPFWIYSLNINFIYMHLCWL